MRPPPDGPARLVRTLTLVVVLQWMGATAVVPMLPLYVRRLGGTDALAGAVMAAFYAAGVLCQYPLGRLADRVGPRSVLVGGLLTYGTASLCFLLPIDALAAIGLRALQGAGAGAATVAGLALVSGAVPLERRGRAFAAVYAGELSGMAVGPLVGSIAGVQHLWTMFLASSLLSFGACLPAARLAAPAPGRGAAATGTGRAGGRGTAGTGGAGAGPPDPGAAGWARTGALVCAGVIGLVTGVYDVCWTLLLVARGASGVAIGISWTLFCVPFVLAARPSGWLADHADRRLLVLVGLGLSTALCASYPFIHSVPALVVLGATEAMGFAAAMPAVQSLLTERARPEEVGRIQGLFATGQTACTALSAAGAGAAFALAPWLPFVGVAAVAGLAIATAAWLWRAVPGRVAQPSEASGPGPLEAATPTLAETVAEPLRT